MLLIHLLRFLKGTVRFTVKGRFIERFLNLASRNGIPIWDTSWDDNIFTGYTLAKKYKELRPFARKTRVHVRISKKLGLGFFVKRYKKRTGIFIGGIGFIVIIFCSGMFVWDIEVNGNKDTSASEIIEVAFEEGLRKGRLKKSIDVSAIEEEICLRFEEIGWAAVNLIGTVAEIEVRESVSPPEKVDDQHPCNIVASRGGQILYMDIYEGQKVVSIKDTVKQGDIIVSGITQNKEGGNMLRHARAKVIAEFEETKTVSFPLNQTVKVPSGSAINYKYIKIGSKYIPLFFGRMNLDESFERTFTRPLTLLGIRFPVDLTIRQVIPAKTETITVSAEKAKEMALTELSRYEQQVTGGTLAKREIINRKTTGKLTNKGYEITAEYVFHENIGKEEEIFIKKQHSS